MKLTEHEMLVTLATAALNMDDFTGHDVLESLKELGYASVIAEARNSGHHQLGDDGCCSLCGISEEEIEKVPVCTETARAALAASKVIEAFVPRVNGKPFHCGKCGSNCFHRYTEDPLKYECNGCGTRYTGEK